MKHDKTEIFIVDDDDAVRDSLCVLLSTAYPRVQGFASGQQFLAEFQPGSRRCLVIDIHMPGMTGLDVIDRLAAMNSSIPTILMTGRVDSVLRARAVASGARTLLDKPIDYDDLINAIEAALVTPSLHGGVNR